MPAGDWFKGCDNKELHLKKYCLPWFPSMWMYTSRPFQTKPLDCVQNSILAFCLLHIKYGILFFSSMYNSRLCSRQRYVKNFDTWPCVCLVNQIYIVLAFRCNYVQKYVFWQSAENHSSYCFWFIHNTVIQTLYLAYYI